ncbi:hypothetical protein MAPG_05083 [Magnaporthiopsis poae ATCC 64411]|uniref:Uncharacterized protein n=1 Tax=Magnaporthiopsis poae (strain ATCC 64411 / 73-15) TaxID=644358 RepID=A0A0C4DYG2_MAGP6|nr:hypothetical protein MAPG_05083 [Magnaporthiopsis poae ATCC 64411]
MSSLTIAPSTATTATTTATTPTASLPTAILNSTAPLVTLGPTNSTRPFLVSDPTGTVVMASATQGPVPLHYGASNATINTGLKKDNYGVLRAYPEPFSRGIRQLGYLASYVADANSKPYEIPIDEPTCFVTPSDGSVSVDPLMDALPTNCTLACMQPRLLFEPTTFATCIQLATAAVFVEAGQAQVDGGHDATRKTSQELAIPRDLTGFNGTKVLTDMVSCAVAACKNKGNGACSKEIVNLGNTPIEPGSLRTLHDALEKYCDHADSVVNEDVAGPGVLMSYIFQTGIALLFFGLSKLFTSVFRPFIWAYMQARSATRADAWRLSGEKQRRLALTRGNAAVISSMVEFQEVQGYFVAAIQVATLVTFRGSEGPELNSVTSLGSILFNSSLVQVLAVSGVLPVLLVQCCLQRAGMRWWYTLGISSIVFILGMTVDIRGGYMLPDFQLVFDYFRRTAAVPECGGNPSPLVYCTGDLSFVVSDDLGQTISYYVYPSLVVEQASWWLWRRYAMERKARRWERSRPWARVLRRRVWPVAWYFYWLLLQVVLTLFTVLYFYNIFSLVSESTLVNDQRWTYGQLVAVMVWAPILGKYLYFNIFGIEEGFGRRLAKHYKVVHRSSHEDSDEDDDDDSESLDGHQVMEQGVELKVTPVPSSTTLPVMPSPGSDGPPAANSPNPSSGLLTSTPDTPTNPNPIPPPPAASSMRPPDHFVNPHPSILPSYDASEDGEELITVGGVVIAVENHAPMDRRGDV